MKNIEEIEILDKMINELQQERDDYKNTLGVIEQYAETYAVTLARNSLSKYNESAIVRSDELHSSMSVARGKDNE